MEYRKQAKAAMNEKISRMTAPLKGPVDASGWEAYDLLNADAKTGMRPVSRRAYKKGGKVEAKPEGKMSGGRADRKAKKDGGKAVTPNSYINRNVKEANQERDGVKHVGGMKKGGRANKNVGGGMPYGGANFGIPQGTGVSKMRDMAGFKKGGKVEKKEDKPSKSAGRAKKQEGGSMMDDYYKKTYTGRGIRAAMRGLGMTDPYEDRAKVETVEPKVMRGGKGNLDRSSLDRANMRNMMTRDPMDDTPRVTRSGERDETEVYAKGGAVDHDAHKAIGHAVGAAMKAYLGHEAEEGERKARKSGGRIAKAAGGGFGEEMNNPKPKSGMPSKGSKTPTINITINTTPKAPMPMVPGGPTVPLGAPPAGMPPMADLGPGPGGMPPMAGPAMGAGAPPPPGPMPLPRKRGGRAMTAGAGSGEGRLQKKEWYGARPPKKDGGGLGMTAGAGSGEGRLQKIDAYGSKA